MCCCRPVVAHRSQGAMSNTSWPPMAQCAISFPPCTCRYVCPSCCLFTSHPNHLSSLHQSQNKAPAHPLRRRCSWGVFAHLSIPAVATRLVSSPSLPACLPPCLPAPTTPLLPPTTTRPRVQSTHGPLPGCCGCCSYHRTSLRATYSPRRRFIPTSARYYHAHLHFFSPHQYPLCFHDLHWVPGLKTTDPTWQSLTLPTLGPLRFSCTEQPRLENALV